jgi:hypothetical protein
MPITAEEFKKALPVKFHSQVSAQSIANINQILYEPEMAEFYRNNFVDYSFILQEGRYSLEDYTNAIKYCSFKIAGLSNKESYIKTFPARYKRHIANGTTEKAIDSYISSYNKTKLVTAILEQSYIPVWLINQDNVQKAINKLVDLMANAQSEKVQGDAANNLLSHLKPPENNKIQLDIGIGSGARDTLNDIRTTLKDLASIQRVNIESGVSNAKDVAESKIIDHKPEEY